jgi:hypothetical protein
MSKNKRFIFTIQSFDGTFQKKFKIRVPQRKRFDSNNPLDNVVIASNISISSEINNGQGEMRVLIQGQDVKFDDFDEGGVIDFENRLKLHVVSDDYPEGKLIYSGIIVGYVPFINGQSQGVHIVAFGESSLLGRSLYKDGSSYDVSRTGEKASANFEEIIDHFRTVYTDTEINYTGSSVDDSVQTFDIDFKKKTWRQALDENHEASPEGFYWCITPDGLAKYKEKDSTATHSFQLGKTAFVEVDKSTEKLFNHVVLEYGSTPTQTEDEDATSIATYGRRTKFFSKPDITSSNAATEFMDKFLAENKDPKRRTKIIIPESYDLESIGVGDTCKFINGLQENSTLFGDNMQIVRTVYKGDEMEIKLEEDEFSLSKEIQAFIQ